MEQEHSENNTDFPQPGPEVSERVPKDSEGFGSSSEVASETDRKVRNVSERSEDHTVTVRDAAKIFEEASIPVTERTIINWCKPNKRGVVRLDCYYDEGDGKYFITPQSIERAMKDEAPRAESSQSTRPDFSETQEKTSERFGNDSEEQAKVSEEVPKDSERFGNDADQSASRPIEKDAEVRELRQQLMDEKILNKGKDYFIEQLRKDREYFAQEREQFVQQMVLQGQRIGRLETELRQLQAPRQSADADDQTPNEPKYNEEGSSHVGVRSNEDDEDRAEGR